MPRFNPKRYRPVHDTTPGLRTVDPTRVVLGIAEFEDRFGCPCGCGEWPKGAKATFGMGHDQRLRGKLIRAHMTATEIVEVYDGKQVDPVPAMAIAARHGWQKSLEDAVQRREGKNREVLARAIGNKRLVSVGRWEYTGQVAAVYRVDSKDYYEMEYVTKSGDVKKVRVPADETMPASE